VWEVNYPQLFNHTLWLPKKYEKNSVKEFLVQEFNRLQKNIEALAGREVAERDLKKSISIYNRNRKLLRELSYLTSQGKTPLTYAQYLAIVRAVMVMPKDQSNALLADLLGEIKDHRETNLRNDFPKVFLFGMLCESQTILDAFDEAGMQIVDDNLYNGSRYLLYDVDESVAPVDGLVNRHLSKDPLSAYHYRQDPWTDYLTNRLKEKNIDGFVFLTPKYCDPSEFDYPFIKKRLQEIEIPALLIETDYSSASDAQIKTRLEAFAEILRGGI
jgi:benzoyl-CoA reductase/2-hydroxyglutaryl-CoA dehydratase subunit BcrC/BadD/HgdB